MDNTKRGSVRKSLSVLILLFVFLISHQSHCAETVPEDEYAMLLENQGYGDDASDSRSKFVSSLNHLLEQDQEDKRSSSFFPLRGKKMFDGGPNNADHYQFQPDHEDKRSQFFPLRGKKIPSELKRASYFMPMRGRKDEDWNTVGEEEEVEDGLDKRASSFMPMRGKKKIGVSNAYQQYGKPGMYSSVNAEINYPLNSENNKIFAKRMSSFIPVRGRKSSEEESESSRLDAKKSKNLPNESVNKTHLEQLRNRRSISFMPMRGRRLLSDSTEQFQNSPGEIVTSMLEKKQYSFMPMRGRRFSYFGESDNNLPTIFTANVNSIPTADMEAKENATQIPGVHLLNENYLSHTNSVPTRSKRSTSHYQSFPEEEIIDKRISSFMPMRGRKNSFRTSNGDSYFSETMEDGKRASSFMPMRGRREFGTVDFDYQPSFENIKRPSFFMPMRGRREDENNFTEKMAKKLSFMPMRGRRYPTTYDLDETDKKSFGFMPMRGRRSHAQNESDEDYDTTYSDEGKRGYAFMPMRGRRWNSGEKQLNQFYSHYPYFIPAGIGSALISRPFGDRDTFISSATEAVAKSRRMYDWDSVKRAFHASRGKRFGNDGLENNLEENSQSSEDPIEANIKPEVDLIKSFRFKRDIFRPQVAFKPQRQYLALKRPMSFFATRGKRMDGYSIDTMTKLQ